MNIIGDAAGGIAGILFVVALWLAGSALYFAPTITAMVMKARNIAVVVVINFVFGWTVIGWVVALAFAISVEKKSEHVGCTPPQQPPYPYGGPAALSMPSPHPPPPMWRPHEQQGWPAQPPIWHSDTTAHPPYGM